MATTGQHTRITFDGQVVGDSRRQQDLQVAAALGWTGFWGDGVTLMGYSPNEQAMGIDAERQPVPEYTTDWQAAGQVWEWLEKNNPWADSWLSLERSKYGKPAVSISFADEGREIEGESYPDAIAKAVILAAKERQENDVG